MDSPEWVLVRVPFFAFVQGSRRPYKTLHGFKLLGVVGVPGGYGCRLSPVDAVAYRLLGLPELREWLR